MTSFPGSPRLIKGGIVIIDPESSKVINIIPLQYNPDSLTRNLQAKSNSNDAANHSEVLLLSGPAVETLKLEISIDATDQLEKADSVAINVGIQPQLTAFEMLIYPTTNQLKKVNSLAQMGTMEIIPMEGPLTLFIWNKYRIMPVRITEFSINEEAFDSNLNPIRAKINMGMRVLSVDDFGFNNKGGIIYMSYQQNKEQLSSLFTSGTFQNLGIDNIP